MESRFSHNGLLRQAAKPGSAIQTPEDLYAYSGLTAEQVARFKDTQRNVDSALPRVLLGTNVYEESLSRIRWIYDEFEHVVCMWSGGKDSTVIMELCVEVAKERSRLPVTVVWMDQEAEWTSVAELARRTAERPEVAFRWYQCPVKIPNAVSLDQSEEGLEFICWDPEAADRWVRSKEPDSLQETPLTWEGKENLYFHYMLQLVGSAHIKGLQQVALLDGVRAAESPSRFLYTSNGFGWKGAPWGVGNWWTGHWARNLAADFPRVWRFHPIYDWRTRDIWKGIADNSWDYCALYDLMFAHGENPNTIRVSSLHHTTAVQNISAVAELDPEAWEGLLRRMSGMNQTNHLTASELFYAPTNLPSAFISWKEYRDYLLDNLITDEAARDKYRRKFHSYEGSYLRAGVSETFYRRCIEAILTNDLRDMDVFKKSLTDLRSGRLAQAQAKARAKAMEG